VAANHVADSGPQTRVPYAVAPRAVPERANSHARHHPRQEPCAVIPLARICAGCALKAHGVQLPEMATAAKLSSQPRTESCVMSGDGHCEA
jgi:hypothetical protein